MNTLIVLPILIPLFSAILMFFTWNKIRAQKALALISTTGVLIVSILLVFWVNEHELFSLAVGKWQSPFGISLMVDRFSAVMILATAIVALLIVIYSISMLDINRESFGFHPMMQIMLLGVYGAFLTADLFNLYVWFEVMLIASFVLMAFGGERPQMEGAVKYVTLNLLSSALFLTALGILYGKVGTLNMADIALKLSEGKLPSGMASISALLFLIGFGIKAGLFPLYFWLPASYHTPPIPVIALFAGILTKVGAYAIIRVFTLVFPFIQDATYLHTVILILAALTMLSGILGAIVQFDVRRLLSFLIISHIGYIVMGLGLYTPFALGATVFYIVQNIFIKVDLFLIFGLVFLMKRTYDLNHMGGIYRNAPGLACLFLIPALSLAGIPPFPGFFGKIALVQAGFDVKQYAIIAISLLVSLLTIYSIGKIWAEAFWKNKPTLPDNPTKEPFPIFQPKTHLFFAYLPSLTLTTFIVLIIIFSEPCFAYAMKAGNQLMHPEVYIQTILQKQ